MAQKKTETTNLTETKLKKFARLEITFSELGIPLADMQDLQVKKPYRVMPEDLLAAIEESRKMSLDQLVDAWAGPLWEQGDVLFHLGDPEAWDDKVEGYQGLPGETFLTLIIWEHLVNQAIEEQCWETEMAEQQLRDLIQMRGVPVPERLYNDAIKECYIDYYAEGNRLQGASEKEILLYVLYTDELAGRKNVTALRAKARGCFGGDPAYPCQWKRARDLFEQLMTLDDDPLYATMLGHIYYAGRVSEGKPDLAKAFYYYSIGAVGGNDEAKLRLSDMFLKGEGTTRNNFIGYKLLEEQFQELLPFAGEGIWDSRLAEAAWRKGEWFLNREDATAEDWHSAHNYLLLAQYAAGERQKIRNGQAEEQIAKDIALSLIRVRGKLQGLKEERELDPDAFFSYLKELYGANSFFTATWKDLKGDKKQLTISRIDRSRDKANQPMLLVLEEQERCCLVEKVQIEISNIWGWQSQLGNKVMFDDFDQREGFSFGGIVTLFCGGKWKLKMPREKAKA